MKKTLVLLLSFLALYFVCPSLGAADMFSDPAQVTALSAEEEQLATQPTRVATHSIALSMKQFTTKPEIDEFMKGLKKNGIGIVDLALRDLETGCVYYPTQLVHTESCAGYGHGNNLFKYFLGRAKKEKITVYGVYALWYDPWLAARKPKLEMQALDQVGAPMVVDNWITPFDSMSYGYLLKNLKEAAIAYAGDISGFYLSHTYFPTEAADLSAAAQAALKKDYPEINLSKLLPGNPEWQIYLSWRSQKLLDLVETYKQAVHRILPDKEFGVIVPSEAGSSPAGYSVFPRYGIDFVKLGAMPGLRILPILDWQAQKPEEAIAIMKTRINLINNWSIAAPIFVLSRDPAAFGTAVLPEEFAKYEQAIKDYMLTQYLGEVLYSQTDPWLPEDLQAVGNPLPDKV